MFNEDSDHGDFILVRDGFIRAVSDNAGVLQHDSVLPVDDCEYECHSFDDGDLAVYGKHGIVLTSSLIRSDCSANADEPVPVRKFDLELRVVLTDENSASL